MHVVDVSQAYLGHISDISRAYLRHISDISQAYLRHISGLSEAYLRHILGISQTYIRNNLRYISGMSQAYLAKSFLIGFSTLSQSFLDTLNAYCTFLDTLKSQSLSPHSHVISCMFIYTSIFFSPASKCF